MADRRDGGMWVMRALRLGRISAFALVAAVFAPNGANACSAISAFRNGVPVVDIVCDAGDPPVAPFFTRYAGSEGVGDDTITVTGGSILDGAAGSTFVDGAFAFDLSTDVIEMLGGNDLVVISGGQIGTATDAVGIVLGPGADTFRMSGGTVTGSVFGASGDDIYEVGGGTILRSIYTGSGDDTVTISGSAFIGRNAMIGPDAVGLEGGDDRFSMTGGTLAGAVSGGSGDDRVTIGGGAISSFVFGNDGVDRIIVTGGSIAGDVDAETVILTGGTIGGNISGLIEGTLFIDDSLSAAPLDLRNGILVSGNAARASISNTDLAKGGTETQVFDGFTSVALDNSTLGFGPGAVGISTLTLENGSILFINGDVSMPGSTVFVTNSSISMMDGAADDSLTLGGLVLDNDPIRLDVNQQGLTADRILASTLSATGVNVIDINLIGPPVFSGPADIPIIITGGPIGGTFIATGLPGTQSALFTYQVLSGGSGLFLRAIPTGFGIALAPQDAADTSTIDTALDALYGINDDAIEFDLGLGNGPAMVQLSDTFGVFASGQLAHTEHDGFEISTNGVPGPGPSFGADDFSAAISLDWNAAKHFGFDDRYGLNLGMFGGYASTDVALDDFLGFVDVGNADNKSGMFGSYALFRQGFNYVLVSATAFLGETDIVNGVLDTTGSYGTTGYAVTGSIGHIFVIGERTRLDLRGGLVGVSFRGDEYVDSGGNRYGGSEISFGALKLEPGIYADYRLENGMMLSPYARAELQQRFGYTNTATIGGGEVSFDDADFSAALSTGFNLKMAERTTLSGEVRGKLSSDSATIAGKLGLKVAF